MPLGFRVDRRWLIRAGLAMPFALGGSLGSAALFSQRISVRTEGNGRDVVLIPGLGAGPKVWASAAAALPERRYTYVHIRGFSNLPAGDNETPPLIDGVVDEIARYIETAKLKRPAIVGHSMGGIIAMLLALRHPDLVDRLMVVDMLPAGAAMVGGTASGLGFLSNQLFGFFSGTEAGRRQLAEMVRGMTPPDAGVSDAQVVALALNELANIDLGPELRNIHPPLTVVYAVPADIAKRRAQRQRYEIAYAPARGATLVPVGPSGHMVMTQQPGLFAEAMRRFLAG